MRTISNPSIHVVATTSMYGKLEQIGIYSPTTAKVKLFGDRRAVNVEVGDESIEELRTRVGHVVGLEVELYRRDDRPPLRMRVTKVLPYRGTPDPTRPTPADVAIGALRDISEDVWGGVDVDAYVRELRGTTWESPEVERLARFLRETFPLEAHLVKLKNEKNVVDLTIRLLRRLQEMDQ